MYSQLFNNKNRITISRVIEIIIKFLIITMIKNKITLPVNLLVLKIAITLIIVWSGPYITFLYRIFYWKKARMVFITKALHLRS